MVTYEADLGISLARDKIIWSSKIRLTAMRTAIGCACQLQSTDSKNRRSENHP